MLQQHDSALWHKVNGTLRRVLLRGWGNGFGDHVVVNEYPKSGGSWIAQMLAEAMDLPFPRNRLPMLRSSILQCHDMGRIGCRRQVIVWRDGRDVAVSWYHHFVIGNQYTASHGVKETRKAIGIAEAANVKANFNKALHYFLTAPRHPRFTWARFADRWMADGSATHMHYEKVLENTSGELKRVAASLGNVGLSQDRNDSIVAKFSFKSQSGRMAGEESKKNYLRKGVAGDWQNYFDAEARTMFHEKAGQQLIGLGYERDDSWTKVR
jgi:Sulfotransferase domain